MKRINRALSRRIRRLAMITLAALLAAPMQVLAHEQATPGAPQDGAGQAQPGGHSTRYSLYSHYIGQQGQRAEGSPGMLTLAGLQAQPRAKPSRWGDSLYLPGLTSRGLGVETVAAIKAPH